MRRLNEGNKVEFDSRDEAIEEGYRSCKNAGREGGSFMQIIKRIAILTTLTCVMLTNLALAANWEPLFSSDFLITFFDTESIRYEKKPSSEEATPRIVFWEKTLYAPKLATKIASFTGDTSFACVSYTLCRCTIDITRKIKIIDATIDFDHEGHIISLSSRDGDVDFSTSSLNSPNNIAAKKIAAYATIHHDDLIYNLCHGR